jgi:putative endonuclease
MKNKIGKLAEDLAAKFLENQGYKIIERNFYFHRFGEIDLIALKKNLKIDIKWERF